MSKKYLIVPDKEIKGVLPRNKRINEPTVLENLNKNDIIRCLKHGNVYMDVNGKWVHVTSYQDTLDTKSLSTDINVINQQPHDMDGVISNAIKRTTELTRPAESKDSIFVKHIQEEKKPEPRKPVIKQEEPKKDGKAPDMESILKEFDKGNNVVKEPEPVVITPEEKKEEILEEKKEEAPSNNNDNQNNNRYHNNNHQKRNR